MVDGGREELMGKECGEGEEDRGDGAEIGAETRRRDGWIVRLKQTFTLFFTTLPPFMRWVAYWRLIYNRNLWYQSSAYQ